MLKSRMTFGKLPLFGIGITFGVVGKTIFDRLKGEEDQEGFVDDEGKDHGQSLSSELKNFELKYGLPKSYPILSYTNHMIEYDMSHKTPSWVLQVINQNTLNGNAARDNCYFKKDLRIPEAFAASSKDYVKSNYSKGHLAAAGDNRSSQEAMDDTFYFTNIVPQNTENNKGIWYQLERFCRKLANKYSNVYVISGPLYLASETDNDEGKRFVKYEVIGEKEIAVPTHLFKVILIESNGSALAVEVFIIPNLPFSSKKRLNSFKFSLKFLEKKLGHQLFPKINHSHLPCICEIENCAI